MPQTGCYPLGSRVHGDLLADPLGCGLDINNAGTVSGKHPLFWIWGILLTLCSALSSGAYRHTHFYSLFNCTNLNICITNLYKWKLMKLIIGSVWWVRFSTDSILSGKLWPKQWAQWVTATFFACEILQSKEALSIEWVVSGFVPAARLKQSQKHMKCNDLPSLLLTVGPKCPEYA